MAANTLANVAAAVAAGYTEVTLDRGASFADATRRWEVVFEKRLVGEPGRANQTPLRAYGWGANQAAAETVALAALNFQRDHRYGKDSAAVSKGADGGTLTLDVH